MLENIVFLILGCVLGAISVGFICRLKLKTLVNQIKHEGLVEITRKDEQIAVLQKDKDQLEQSGQVNSRDLAAATHRLNEFQQKMPNWRSVQLGFLSYKTSCNGSMMRRNEMPNSTKRRLEIYVKNWARLNLGCITKKCLLRNLNKKLGI